MSAISIVLPTYNRASFLPQSFDAVRSQRFTDWELIVVDDGSTDNTCDLVRELSPGFSQPIRYLRQENKGAAAARNTGIAHSSGRYIAFYDSDDLWLPHHLAECFAAMESNCDVDWVWAAMSRIDCATGEILTPHTFRENGIPHPFLKLKVRRSATLNIVNDKRFFEVVVRHGGMIGNLQASLFRRTVFDKLCLPEFRIGEDQAFLPSYINHGFKLAYIDSVHVHYHVHNDHVSGAGKCSIEKHIKVQQELIRALSSIKETCNLTALEISALDNRLSREMFWNLGYRMWSRGNRSMALKTLRDAIRLNPYNIKYWKTYLSCWFKLPFLRAYDLMISYKGIDS